MLISLLYCDCTEVCFVRMLQLLLSCYHGNACTKNHILRERELVPLTCTHECFSRTFISPFIVPRRKIMLDCFQTSVRYTSTADPVSAVTEVSSIL
jgi:hypothetical protein